MKEFGITQDEIAKGWVKANLLLLIIRLLNLSTAVRKEISINVITERHARALLKLEDERIQLQALNEIYKEPKCTTN